MNLLAFCVLLSTAATVNGVKHSLFYIYTALSKPVDLPGIHEFTAMGMLNNRTIDYFDSDKPKKVPKQKWMEDRLTAGYWDKGTKSCQNTQRWFKDNINTLMKRMRQDNSDVHVLQGIQGCEGEEQPDGKLKYHRGLDRYSYDGDFLSFDDRHSVWLATADAAIETETKWDEEESLTEHTKGYLENECMQWLNMFMEYWKKEIMKAPPPDIYLFATKAKVETRVVLVCLATGFYPEDIQMYIRRNNLPLTRSDGVFSSGVRPNEDGTHQRRDHVEIPKTDTSSYSCQVVHPATNLSKTEVLDHELPDSGGHGAITGGVLGSVVVIAAVVLVVLVVLCRTGIIGGANNGRVIEAQPQTFPSSPAGNQSEVTVIKIPEGNQDDSNVETASLLTGSTVSLSFDSGWETGADNNQSSVPGSETSSLM